MIIKCAALLLVLVPVGATASTPASWKQLDRRSGRACLAISGLAYPELLAAKTSFSDTIGVDLRMIRGRDSKGRSKRLLCAYDRKTGRAEVQDANDWTGPTIKP